MDVSSYSWRDNKVLLAALIPVCIGTILLINLFGTVISVLVLALIGFISILFVSYRYPRYNILILLGSNFFIPLLVKIFMLYDIPFGIFNEGLCFTMLLTLTL